MFWIIDRIEYFFKSIALRYYLDCVRVNWDEMAKIYYANKAYRIASGLVGLARRLNRPGVVLEDLIKV